MTLKGEGKGPLPPLLQQYVDLRERYPDYLLLFQVGDFYECFGEDAERLARTMGLILTHKSSKDFVTPMAGVPLRSADQYIERLLAKGFRVAIADQLEHPSEADGLVRRDITQLITPGTVTSETLLKRDANYLAAIATGDGYGLAFLDVTTGEFRGTRLYAKSSLLDELERYRPAEVLLAPELYYNQALRESVGSRFTLMQAESRFELDEAQTCLQTHFGALPGELSEPALVRAAGAVLGYALETQQGRLPQVTHFLRYDPGAYMQLDDVSLATLEVFRSRMGAHEGGTLLSVLDETRTAPGRRLLSSWLRHPLLDAALIAQRLDAVEALVHDHALRAEIRKALHKVFDLERLASRLAAQQASARDLAALGRSLALIPHLKAQLSRRREQALAHLAERLEPLGEVQTRIAAALVDNPPPKLGEGGLIRDGFDTALDRLRATADEGRAWIANLEAHERAASGIPTLKIGFNGVFGYYFEVTRPYYEKVPEDFRPLQTLKDRQRYSRADLRDKEREILRAEEAARRREYEVFSELREGLAAHAERVRELGAVLAELDVYTALADVAVKQGYCRPTFSPSGVLDIRAGRHPVVERFHPFIANDVAMSPRERFIVLTGPNMSGKSTYLRQVALCALLAQIGSFVPAESATLPLFDRIFTRIGASDDIAGGRSTFMVEMEELSRILHNATANSLVLLDEIGRGTSTFDGLALAWAASEHLHDAIAAYTLFATHYFELTSLATRLSAARNYHVAAKEEAGGLVFYHQVVPGPASKAYGIEVARLAGVPARVLARAQSAMAQFEAAQGDHAKEVLERLLAQDVSRLSPLEALKLLYELQEQARGLVVERDP
jgi:DNA mismatch repair protein MutS